MEELLTALLAPVADGRRYWVRALQGVERPYVVMYPISGLHDYTFQGDDGLVSNRVQIDAYGDTYTSTKDAADQIASILSGYRDGPIRGIFIERRYALPASDTGEVNNLFRLSTDVTVWSRV